MDRVSGNISTGLEEASMMLDSVRETKGKSALQRQGDLEKAAKEFEAFFVSQIFDSINQAMPQSEFLGGGNEMQVFQSMFIEEVTKAGAQRGRGMGLAEGILREMKGRVSSVEAPAGELEAPDGVKISSKFGMREDPITGKHRHHSGMDVALPMRTPLHATEAGTVIFSGVKGGYGKAVLIQHPSGLTTLYAHNDENLVKQGQVVQAGEMIGYSGSSGRSTGPHLHLEVRREGRPLDPEKYVKLDKIL